MCAYAWPGISAYRSPTKVPNLGWFGRGRRPRAIHIAGGGVSAGSLEPSGLDPDSRHPVKREVGHSGHIGITPIFDEVCPLKPLQHKAFDGFGTLGTLGTVDLQGGEGKAEKKGSSRGKSWGDSRAFQKDILLIVNNRSTG